LFFRGENRETFGLCREYEKILSMRRYTARIAMGHICELLSRPKVSLRSLILRGTLGLNKLRGSARKIHTALREKSIRLCENNLCGSARIDRSACRIIARFL